MQMGKMDFLAFFFCDKKQKSQGNWLLDAIKMNFCYLVFGKLAEEWISLYLLLLQRSRHSGWCGTLPSCGAHMQKQR
ncbi:hypothetical protein GFC30_1977 [Anoxybacillus amylolyticus]|uniref:Uncharacterized protein n=1 Tax=Anoxybacteroides amylolyticum TaxID=294699 RepID=A0A160F3R6_9BACL|nr:hypothetical protein GFC30_1977 [Anoxybacillus amylolyticus]